MHRLILVLILLLSLSLGTVFSRDKLVSHANLRFSHKTHDQNNVDCARCHINREGSQNEHKSSLPSGWQPLRKSGIVATGVSMIFTQHDDINDTFGRPGEKRCLECHFKTREKADCAR